MLKYNISEGVKKGGSKGFLPAPEGVKPMVDAEKKKTAQTNPPIYSSPAGNNNEGAKDSDGYKS